jgi:hypothetical protein
MWKKIAIGGAVAAATAGVGMAAVATSGWPTTSGTPGTSGTSSTPGTPATEMSGATLASVTSGLSAQDGRRAGQLLRRAAHGQWVARDRNTGAWITHDAIRGSVTAVSATSITVKAPDNVSETFVVGSDTKVRQRQAGKATDSSIAAVHTGDEVVVLGTGSDAFAATRIVDIKK